MEAECSSWSEPFHIHNNQGIHWPSFAVHFAELLQERERGQWFIFDFSWQLYDYNTIHQAWSRKEKGSNNLNLISVDNFMIIYHSPFTRLGQWEHLYLIPVDIFMITLPLTRLGQWEPSKVSIEAFYSYTFAFFQVSAQSIIISSYHHHIIIISSSSSFHDHIIIKTLSYQHHQLFLPSWSPQSQGLRFSYGWLSLSIFCPSVERQIWNEQQLWEQMHIWSYIIYSDEGWRSRRSGGFDWFWLQALEVKLRHSFVIWHLTHKIYLRISLKQ